MKRYLRFITILLILIIPSNIFAASINIECPFSIEVGNEIICTVTANHESMAGLRASISYSKLDYKSSTNLTDSNMFVVSNTGLDGAFDITKNNIKIAQYVFLAKEVGQATIKIDCQEMIDGNDFSSLSCSGITKTVEIKEKPIINPNPEPKPDPDPVTPPISPTPKPEAPKNSDSTLNNIVVNDNRINIVANQYVYDIQVENSVDTVNIEATANNNQAIIKGLGIKNLNVGKNSISINVTAEDGISKNTYTINVTRKEEVASSNLRVKNISINNYNFNFDASKKEYELSISDEDYLTINVELEDKNAKYEIIGNKDLKNKSIIIIKVLAEDGSTNEYKINIAKPVNITKNLSISLTISILFNIFLWSILMHLVIKIRKNKTI